VREFTEGCETWEKDDGVGAPNLGRKHHGTVLAERPKSQQPFD
jgi:hypothetical protein